jgi:predicted nucleic acid-binding protein
MLIATALERIQEISQGSATGKPKIAFDTCCVQYYISNPPIQPWADCLDPIIRAGLEGKVELYVSNVVVAELLSHVHFAHRNGGYDPELGLLAILNRHFHTLDVNGEVARAAGRLRGTYVPGDKITLKTPDALIGATSVANGHTLFVTNDRQLANALPDESCVFLREVATDHLKQMFPACLDATNGISPGRRGVGFPRSLSMAALDVGSIQPDPSASWKRILSDCITAATALNEPCAFFVLTQREGRKTKTNEVLFWHEGLEATRPVRAIIKRLYEHLGYSARTGNANNPNNRVHAFCFTSFERELLRQSQPCFASKSDEQRTVDAWNGYLSLLWRLRSTFGLPQMTLLLCEDGCAQFLKADVTGRFLDLARNVLGWEEQR